MWYRLISIALLAVAFGVCQQGTCQASVGEGAVRQVVKASSSNFDATRQMMSGRGSKSTRVTDGAQDTMFDISMLIFCFVAAALLFVMAIVIVRYRNKRP